MWWKVKSQYFNLSGFLRAALLFGALLLIASLKSSELAPLWFWGGIVLLALGLAAMASSILAAVARLGSFGPF